MTSVTIKMRVRIRELGKPPDHPPAVSRGQKKIPRSVCINSAKHSVIIVQPDDRILGTFLPDKTAIRSGPPSRKETTPSAHTADSNVDPPLVVPTNVHLINIAHCVAQGPLW